MTNQNYEIIISTCGKFSDLWDANVRLLNRNWPDRNARTYLVTDDPTDRTFPGVEVVSAGAGREITDRLKTVLDSVSTEYVIFTLEDYFLTERIHQEKIDRALQFLKEYGADYIQLYPQPRGFLRRDGARQTKDFPGIYLVDLSRGNYKVVLTPGIWRTDFMRKTLEGTEPMNAWQYEVFLTQRARQLKALCATSNCGEFPYLDVIRKGKILPKAARYFRKHPIYRSDREVMPWRSAASLEFRGWLKRILPAWLFRAVKKFMIRRGHTFYSPVS